MSEEARITEDDPLRRQALHDTLAAQARADQQASSDSFDNQLLTFSSALLGLSVAFIKDIVPLCTAIWMPCLYTSWVVLAICILSTIASFRFGVEAQKEHSDHLYKYYIERKQEFFNKQTGWTRAISWCSSVSAVTFLAGLILTISFAVKNVSESRKHGKQPETTKSDCSRCAATIQNGDGQGSPQTKRNGPGSLQDSRQGSVADAPSPTNVPAISGKSLPK